MALTIALSAGVAQGLLHYHFGQKEGLYAAVIARRSAAINTARLRALDAVDPADPDALERVLDALVRPPLGPEGGGAAYARIFAAITGISIASAAVFTKIAVPQMIRHGYAPRFAVGVVAGSSVLGMLIPPFGISVYAIKSTLDDRTIGLGQIFAGAAPFAAIMLVVLLLVIAFPWIATGLL